MPRTQAAPSMAAFALSCTFVAGLGGLAGCGSDVSQSNYDKISNGMTVDQVESILGKSKEQQSSEMATPGMAAGGLSVPGMSMKALTWKDGSKTISVTFQNDKVMSKAENGL